MGALRLSRVSGYSHDSIRKWRKGTRVPSEFQRETLVESLKARPTRLRREWTDLDMMNLALHRSRRGATNKGFAAKTGFPAGFVSQKWNEHLARLAADGVGIALPWTAAADRALLSMREFGNGWGVIGQRLGRSATACKSRHQKLRSTNGMAK
jgi:hypothetical protein